MITATVHSEALPADPKKPPRCQLVVIEGPDMGRAARLGSEELIVGTGAECGLQLTDTRVSRKHLSLRADEGRFLARDLESRNGTYFEGSRLFAAHVPLGATLRVGHSALRLQQQPQALQVHPSQARRFGELVGESLALREVFAVLELCAQSEVTVLVEGETGSGKELVARALHAHRPRRSGPFVALDCGALPENLVESELFGHVRGAFTGASEKRAGAFARAHGGTLFLDELQSVPLPVQARLLRVLETRMVQPVGGDQERAVDVCVVAAAGDDLSGRVAAGQFRPDLYYRLSVVKVALPPLRQRREDIPPLVSELLRRRGLNAGTVAGPNLDALLSHDWPGNVRELRNVLDRAVALTPGARCFADLRLQVVAQALGGDEAVPVRTDLGYAEAKALALAAFERRYLGDLLSRCDGNVSAASRLSGLDRKHLRTLLRRHELLGPAKAAGDGKDDAKDDGADEEEAPDDGAKG